VRHRLRRRRVLKANRGLLVPKAARRAAITIAVRAATTELFRRFTFRAKRKPAREP
jgi:hypothetical protein